MEKKEEEHQLAVAGGNGKHRARRLHSVHHDTDDIEAERLSYVRSHRDARHKLERMLKEKIQHQSHRSNSFHEQHRILNEGLVYGRASTTAFDSARSYSPYAKNNPHDLRRRLLNSDKQELCMVLAECVAGMSVYFHSDDIDNESGEVDDFTVVFDEDDIENKHTAVTHRARQVLEASASDSAGCDRLLREFHRTIEVSGIPYVLSVIRHICSCLSLRSTLTMCFPLLRQ